MLIDYRDNMDKSLNYTAKSTLIEHYQEQTRANTVMGFAISLIIAFVGILNFVNSMLTAIVSPERICHDTEYRHDKTPASQYAD